MINSKSRIVHFGPVSYVGGVSTHIKRLVYLLQDEFDFCFIDESPPSLSNKDFPNLRSVGDYRRIYNEIKKSDLVHIHSGNWLIRNYVMIIAILLNKNFIVTLHSFRLSKFQRFVTSGLLSRAKCVLTVNKEIRAVLPKRINKIIVKEAFLPPVIELEPPLSEEVLQRIHTQEEGTFLLCANAFRLQKQSGGELYGIDQCIEVASFAKQNDVKLHIIFVIGVVKEEDESYFESFQQKIDSEGLGKFITIIPYSLPFIRLIMECDVVLRPTLSDGDALTIREALFLNKKVIASDVVERPVGTITYETGSSLDLFEKIRTTSKGYKLQKVIRDKRLSQEGYYSFYLKIYKECNN